jgi:hypothetical protein
MKRKHLLRALTTETNSGLFSFLSLEVQTSDAYESPCKWRTTRRSIRYDTIR